MHRLAVKVNDVSHTNLEMSNATICLLLMHFLFVTQRLYVGDWERVCTEEIFERLQFSLMCLSVY